MGHTTQPEKSDETADETDVKSNKRNKNNNKEKEKEKEKKNRVSSFVWGRVLGRLLRSTRSAELTTRRISNWRKHKEILHNRNKETISVDCVELTRRAALSEYERMKYIATRNHAAFYSARLGRKVCCCLSWTAVYSIPAAAAAAPNSARVVPGRSKKRKEMELYTRKK